MDEKEKKIVPEEEPGELDMEDSRAPEEGVEGPAEGSRDLGKESRELAEKLDELAAAPVEFSELPDKASRRARDRAKRFRAARLRSVAAAALFLAAAALAGLSVFLGVRNREERALRRQSEAQVQDLEGRLAAANDSLSQANDTIGELERKLEEDPFVPGHPDYEDLYPDFYAPQKLDASASAEGTIYLTFDDGPSDRTDEVLSVLAQEGVKGTFFVVGQYAESEASIQRMKNIVAQGHTLGMHSYSHNYTDIYASVENFLNDMYKVFTLIRDNTGAAPTAFRFPGGSINSYNYGTYQAIIAEMLRRGFVPYDWNLSAEDATGTPISAEQIVQNVVGQSAGKIRGFVLMHDSASHTATVEALPEMIRQLKAEGFTFAAITPDVKPTLFGYKAIQ